MCPLANVAPRWSLGAERRDLAIFVSIRTSFVFKKRLGENQSEWGRDLCTPKRSEGGIRLLGTNKPSAGYGSRFVNIR